MTATINPLPSNRVGVLREPAPCIRCNAIMATGTRYGWAPTTKGKFHADAADCPQSVINAPDSPPVRPMQPAATAAQPDATAALSGLAALIAPYLESKLQGTVNESQVRDIVEQSIDEIIPTLSAKLKADLTAITVVQIQQPDAAPVNVTNPHPQFALMSTIATTVLPNGQRLFPYLAGGAGSGKSFAAKQLAKALGLECYVMSCCEETPASEFMGYMDAQGRYVPSKPFHAYTEGGVLVVDEADKLNPNTFAIANGILASDRCGFGDKMYDRHPDFYCIATGNTVGKGSSSNYQSNVLDGASLSRFVVMPWDWDEGLEMRLALEINPAASSWVSWVHRARKIIADENIPLLPCSRAIYSGAALLSKGLTLAQVADICLFKGQCQQTTKDRLLGA